MTMSLVSASKLLFGIHNLHDIPGAFAHGWIEAE